jgi:hypothetical protein
MIIKLTKEDTKKFMSKRTPKRDNVEPHKRLNNFYEPIERGCAFPNKANPQIKRGRARPNIHKMWKFDRVAPKRGA